MHNGLVSNSPAWLWNNQYQVSLFQWHAFIAHVALWTGCWTNTVATNNNNVSISLILICFVWKETNSITVTEVHQFSTYNVKKKKQVTILKIILSLSNQLLVTARIENLVMEDWTFKNVNKCCYHLCGLWSDCNVLIFWLFFVSLESSMLWVSILVFKIKCKFQIKGY